jgi:RimJ/RimL family protein N-acetyltransferase
MDMEIAQLKGLFPIKIELTDLYLFRETDITENYINWLNDPEVMKFSEQRFKQHDFASCYEYYKSFQNSNNLFISIVDSYSKSSIGTMTVYFDVNHKVADIGILIGNRDFWGKGIGKEAWNGVMDLLFTQTKIRKVTGGTLSCNHIMINIMKNSGMHDEVRRNHVLVNRQEFDVLYFAKFNKSV